MENKWYVWDALEIIMGSYDTFENAYYDMQFMIDECYLLDDYPDPYVAQEAIEYDYFNWEEWEHTKYKHFHDVGLYELEDLPIKENYRKRGKI